MSSSTNLGRAERAAHSAERSFTCCSVGICPIINSIPSTSNLIRQKEPKEALGKRFLTTGSLREFLLTLRDSLPTKSDALFRIEDRPFPYKTWIE